MVDAWKDARLPEKQLVLNMKELAGKYPPHWKALLQTLRQLPSLSGRFYDIGCGVGTTYALLRQERIPLTYNGIDFSEAMIKAAQSTWGAPHMFRVDDYRTTTQSYSDGILYCTGLLDIVEDGVKELTRLLSFGCPYVILNRVNIGSARQLQTYQAYDTITCYCYTFSYLEFLDTIRAAGYSLISQVDTCYLLRKNIP